MVSQSAAVRAGERGVEAVAVNIHRLDPHDNAMAGWLKGRMKNATHFLHERRLWMLAIGRTAKVR